MEVPHLFPRNVQDRLSFHKSSRPFCFSPLQIFTPALLCHPNYLHGAVDVSHLGMPNIVQIE